MNTHKDQLELGLSLKWLAQAWLTRADDEFAKETTRKLLKKNTKDSWRLRRKIAREEVGEDHDKK